MKKDINHHEAIYKNWKEDALEYGVEGLSKDNSKLLIDFISDMEIGQNVARRTKKGGRSYGRLNVCRIKLRQIFIHFQNQGIDNISKVKEKQLHEWSDGLTKGTIKRKDGEQYKYPSDFTRNLKTWWHWWMKVNRKKGKQVLDICEDLSLENPENTFVYLSKEQVEEMLPYFSEEEQVLIIFLFDSLVRFPTEASSLTAKNVYEKDGEVWVDVPKEISKTIGRSFNLLYCGDSLLKLIKDKELEDDDYIFDCISESNRIYAFNTKLKQVAVQLWGDKISEPKAKKKFSELSGYDLRHDGCVHLRFLASRNGRISLDSLRQRGGWVDFKMLNYYSKFLNLDGKISKEDTLIEEDKSKLQKRVDELENQVKDIDTIKLVLKNLNAHQKALDISRAEEQKRTEEYLKVEVK